MVLLEGLCLSLCGSLSLPVSVTPGFCISPLIPLFEFLFLSLQVFLSLWFSLCFSTGLCLSSCGSLTPLTSLSGSVSLCLSLVSEGVYSGLCLPHRIHVASGFTRPSSCFPVIC